MHQLDKSTDPALSFQRLFVVSRTLEDVLDYNQYADVRKGRQNTCWIPWIHIYYRRKCYGRLAGMFASTVKCVPHSLPKWHTQGKLPQDAHWWGHAVLSWARIQVWQCDVQSLKTDMLTHAISLTFRRETWNKMTSYWRWWDVTQHYCHVYLVLWYHVSMCW